MLSWSSPHSKSMCGILENRTRIVEFEEEQRSREVETLNLELKRIRHGEVRQVGVD